MPRKGDSLADQIYDAAADGLSPLMSGRGFRRKGRYEWYFWDADARYHLSTILDKGSRFAPYLGLVSMYVGVGYRSLTEFLRPVFDFRHLDPKDPVGIRGDTGLLNPAAHRHGTWPISADTDPGAVAAEIAHDVRTYVFPFFERFGPIDNAVAAWEQGREPIATTGDPRYFLLATYWLRGEKSRAIKGAEALLSAEESARTGKSCAGCDKAARFLKHLRKLRATESR